MIELNLIFFFLRITTELKKIWIFQNKHHSSIECWCCIMSQVCLYVTWSYLCESQVTTTTSETNLNVNLNLNFVWRFHHHEECRCLFVCSRMNCKFLFFIFFCCWEFHARISWSFISFPWKLLRHLYIQSINCHHLIIIIIVSDDGYYGFFFFIMFLDYRKNNI